MSEYEDKQDGDDDAAEDLEMGDEADDVIGGRGVITSDPDAGGHFA